MLLSFVIVLTCVVTPILGAECARDYKEVNGRCFRYEDHKRSYDDAQEDCRSEGANLAWIPDFTDALEILEAFDDFDKYAWIGARRVNRYDDDDDDCESYLERPTGERLCINGVGFWGKGQPKDKKDYECVLVKAKKGHGHHGYHGHKSRGKGKHHSYDDKGLEWELKKCKDKKPYLCEQRCDAGEKFCGGKGCVLESESCYIRPPLVDCNGEHDFSTDGPVFRSTGYVDGKYPANGICIYQLSVAVGYILKLEFIEFSLDVNKQDFIEIFTGSTMLADARFYGRYDNSYNLKNRVIYSTNNKMVIVLRSDSKTAKDGRGFVVRSTEFVQPPSVIEEIITITLGGVWFIASPGFGDNTGEPTGYSANWRLEAPAYSQIIFELDAEIRLADDSTLEILSVLPGEEYVRIAWFKGHVIPATFISTTNICVIRYRTGSGPHWFSKGFKISVTVSSGNTRNCNQRFTEDMGVVTSPGYGRLDSNDERIAYPVNYRCEYLLVFSPLNGNFSFWFDEVFGIDKDDKLEIDNSGVMKRWEIDGYVSGADSEFPSKQYTAYAILSLVFTTNSITHRKDIPGFKMSYSKDCPPLVVSKWTLLHRELPDNNDLASSSGPPYQYGHVVEISCLEGYEFQDNYWSGSVAAVECLWGGWWNVSRIPVCQPVFCGLPDSINQGYVSFSSGGLFGDIATYKCLDGLTLMGNENVTCQADKTWSTPPHCTEVSCTLSQPEDGISSHELREGTAEPLTNSTYGFGAVVELECIDGYYVDGVMSIYCTQHYEWSGTLGQCKKISCPFVPVKDGVMSLEASEPSDLDGLLTNLTYFYQFYTASVTYVPTIEFGDKARVWCRHGYAINGTSDKSAEVSCTADRSFTEVDPCVDYDECTMANPCDQHCFNTEGSFYCECDKEYKLNDDGSCTLIPGCDANPEACDHTCTNTSLPQWFECSCSAPYILYDELGAHGWFKHSMDTVEEKLRVNQSCVLPQCPLEEIVSHFNEQTHVLAHVDDDVYPLHFNDSVMLYCERGYTFSDGDRMKEFTCTSDGWMDMMNISMSSFNCSMEVTCNGTKIPVTGVPFSKPHVQHCGHPFNYDIVSHCDLDPHTNEYKLFSDAVCPEIDCGDPRTDPLALGGTNITVSCTTLNCSFEFACAGGLEPLPAGTPSTIVCMENGKWNYSNIYCEGMTCGDPGAAAGTYRYATESMSDNETITIANLRSGGKLYYKCINEGYTLYSNGSVINHTTCDGANFSPNVSTFECVDTQPPVVSYCPAQIEVFRYHRYHGAPFDMGDFMGYASPHFTDNAGIREVTVRPYTFHRNHVFTEDLNVTFTATDFQDLSTDCTIQFLVVGISSWQCQREGNFTVIRLRVGRVRRVSLDKHSILNVFVDLEPPTIQCESLNLSTAASEVTVTDESILGAVTIQKQTSHDSTEVVITDSHRNIGVQVTELKLTRHATVRVHRVFYSGDVTMGTNRTINRTQTSQCKVSIRVAFNLCLPEFAPNPNGADKNCVEFANGTTQCSYTCQDPNAVLYQSSSEVSNTATLMCSDSNTGYTSVSDCVASVDATASTAHFIFLQSTNLEDDACYEKLVSGYKDWALNDICKGAVEDIQFINEGVVTDDIGEVFTRNGKDVSLVVTWNVIAKDGLQGTEAICSIDNPDQLLQNLTSIDPCLSSFDVKVTSLTAIDFTCENQQDTLLVVVGAQVVDNVTYPHYSCSQCPAGMFYDGGICTACPTGSFAPVANKNTECIECPGPTDSLEEGSTTCFLTCSNGYVADNGVYPCLACPMGTYSVNKTHCEQCPEGTAGRYNAQSSVDSCKPKCGAGTYSYDGYVPESGECIECPVNFYQNATGATECMRCADNDYTNGATGQTECMLFEASCPSELAANCSHSSSCLVQDGLFFCTNGCERPDASHGKLCDIPTTICHMNLCDPLGSIGCEDGKCICNEAVATGEFCQELLPLPIPTCLNGGESFTMGDAYEPGANMSVICLCGERWSGANCTEVESKCAEGVSPCVEGHHDSCVNEDVRARCECKMGYTGYNCEIDINGCYSSPCLNGGNCSDIEGSAVTDGPYEYMCDCPPGFSGQSCEFRLDECDDSVCGDHSVKCMDNYMSVDSVYCLSVYYSTAVNANVSTSITSYCEAHDIKCENGGTCEEDDKDRYKCVCPPIYDGECCQHRIDFCEDDPCGEGECTNKVDEVGYTCECATGYEFSDTTCVNINECTRFPNLCKKGECVNTKGSYYCVCDEQHAGKHCETNIDKCLLSPCYEDGGCIDRTNDYLCICSANRTGEHCYEEKSHCSDQCENEGVCHPVYGDYVCQCKNPSYGRHCQHLPDICEIEKPCVHGGDCQVASITTEGYICTNCDEGFYGNSCEKWANECTENPCSNGGSCILKRFSGYTCECRPGFAGEHCELKLDPCSGDPCPNAATCVRQGFYRYTCVCPPGRIGSSCETTIDVNFDLYINVGEYSVILDPTVSVHWTITKFTISTWVRPDRIVDEDDNFIDFIHLTVDDDVVLKMNAHACMFNGVWYNITTNAEASLAIGYWAFYAVSVDTAGGKTTITIYTNGLSTEYTLGNTPEEKLGPLNIKVSPTRQFLGYCSQTYLWAGASFPRSKGSQLNALLTLPRGDVISGAEFQVSYIHYYWSVGLYRNSPFCEIGIPSRYCTICDDEDIGTFLEFERGCPNDIVITTSARSAIVTWDPPKFLANGRPLTADPPNIPPGTELGLGRHRIRYSASKNGKRLRCKFNVYVRFGCEGTVVNSRCIRPYKPTTLVTKSIAQFKCQGFGGVLIEIDDEEADTTVKNAILAAGHTGKQFMVGSHYNDSSDPQCVVLTSGGDLEPESCTNPVSFICGRPVTTTESCALPKTPSNLILKKVALPAWSRLIKYKLTCKDEGYILPSYIPKEITCYPEGNWDTNFGAILPPCLLPAPPAVRFRVKIRISFKIKMRSPCRVGGTYNSYSVLFAVRRVLFRLKRKWKRLIRAGRGDPVMCCDDPDKCDTSSSCRFKPYALSCRCGRFIGKRRRRATEDENENEIDIALDEIEGDVEDTDGGEGELSAEDVITQAVAANEFNEAVKNASLDVVEDESPLSSLQTSTNTDCPEGYQSVDDECTPCTVGTYWTNGTCDFCDFNTYQPGENATECIPCGGDNITYYTGSIKEDDCVAPTAAGSFFNSQTQKAELCARGTYQADANQLACELCPPSQTTPTTGSISADNCTDKCDSGTEYSSATDLCVLCDVGYYRDAALDEKCVKCPDGKITDGEGSKTSTDCSIVDCKMGSYRDVAANTCEGCLRGSFQNETRQTECIPCGDNFTTSAVNSSQAIDCRFICPDGHEEKVAGSCSLCEVGSYRTKDVDNIPDNKCTSCDQYWTTESHGSSTEAQCSILVCPVGMQANSTKDGCEDCSVGYYSDKVTNVSQTCDQCPVDYTTSAEGSDSQDDCFISCPKAGEEHSQDGNSCVPCMKGYYAELNDQMCKSCDLKALTPGMTRWDTVGNGSTSQTDCSIAMCAAGYKVDNSGVACEACAIGEYQENNDTLATSCTLCPTSQTTVGNASTSLSQCRVTCPAGSQDVDDKCELCPKGTYKDAKGPEECTECTGSLTTAGAGSNSSSDCNIAVCDPGYYSNGAVCDKCPIGTYQDEDDFTGSECEPCGSINGFNKTTKNTTSMSESDCEVECDPGYEKDDTTGCVICPVDFYDDGTNECVACDSDLSTNGVTGSVDANGCNYRICTKGQENNNADPLVCDACPRNKYNDDPSGKCKECPDNRETMSVESEGAEDCIKNCDSGKGYNAATDSCDGCSRGMFRVKSSNNYYCEMCPTNKTTASTGSSACDVDVCEPGKYAKEGSGTYTCTECEIGKYQADEGQLECVSCKDGFTTKSKGSINEASCVPKPTCNTKSPCLHSKHTCEMVDGAPVCTCPTAYEQAQVGDDFTCTHLCSRKSGGTFCQNDGICNDYVDDIQLVCTCNEDWQGTNCSTAGATRRRQPTTVLAIVGAVSGVVLIGLVSAAAVAFCKKVCKPSGPKKAAYVAEPVYIDPVRASPYPLYNTHNSGKLMLRDVEEVSQRGRPNYDSYVIQ